MDCYSVVKRNELSHHEETWRKFKYLLLNEWCQPEKFRYYNDFNSMTYGKGKTIDTVKWSVVAKVYWGERNELAEHEDFGGILIFLYDSIMMSACHYAFIQTHRIHNTKSEPWSKPWAWGDNDTSVQVHWLKNDTVLCKMPIVEETMGVSRQGV